MKKINSQKAWSWVGIFIIALVVSLPFESAQALAVNVQITKNSGQAGIDQFIDANGDVWTVQATISGLSSGSDNSSVSVDPKDLKLKIGDNEAEFTSCSQGSFGVDCQYISPLTDGVKEGEWGFQVVYTYLSEVLNPKTASAGDIIKADGSGPKVTELSVSQDKTGDNSGKVLINFKVSDVYTGKPAVGIKKIDVLDADTGAVLQTITDLASGTKEYVYAQDPKYNGLLQAQLSGEGLRKIKVIAEDVLGHKSSDAAFAPLDTDFVNPVIQENINFTSLGKFVGGFLVETDIMVDVLENNLVDDGVIASSDQIKFNSQTAECDSDDVVDGLWHCIWKNAVVNPTSPISLTVKAIDEYGNKAEKVFSPTFTDDVSAPEVVYFGTKNLFEDKSFVKSGKQKIVLQVKDQGSWINIKDIAADLSALGGDAYQVPAESDCLQSADNLECLFTTSKNFASEGFVEIGLSKLKDKVGNEAKLPRIQLFVDNSPPKVKKLESYGVSEIGEKDYYQSNDKLKLKFNVEEAAGVFVLLNLKEVVMDAENLYLETGLVQDLDLGEGWQVFDGKDVCKRNEQGSWDCQVETEPIKSGPDHQVVLKIKVVDTAGNSAEEWPEKVKNLESYGSAGTYQFELLALSNELNPNYWEAGKITPVGGSATFVDIDVAPLTYSRIPFMVPLVSSIPDAKAINIEMVGCQPKLAGDVSENASAETPAVESSPEISRSLIYGGVSSDGIGPKANINLILEFVPFDGREIFGLKKEFKKDDFKTKEVEYLCQVKIFSKVGDNAISASELQDFVVKVPFGFTSLGAQDENLDAKIKKARDDATTWYWETIGTLNSILKWIDYGVQTIQLVTGAISLIQTAQGSFDTIRELPPTTAAAISTCLGMNVVTQKIDTGIAPLDAVVQVLSCRPGPELGWYHTFSTYVPDLYNQFMNIEIFKSPGSPCNIEIQKGGNPEEINACQFKPARSIKDNLYLSMAGFCVPGIIKNLDKWRQIKCRKIACLENEVKSGLATVEMCDELESLLTCKYFLGELWYIFPFSRLYDQAIIALQNSIKDPIALAHTLTLVGCGLSCAISNELAGGCVIAYYVWGIIDYLESIASFFTTIYQDINSGGLQYCDSVL